MLKFSTSNSLTRSLKEEMDAEEHPQMAQDYFMNEGR
jgi:hypothetical protein